MTPHEENVKLREAEQWHLREKAKPKVLQAHPKAACERCVYARGKHAGWCPVGRGGRYPVMGKAFFKEVERRLAAKKGKP